MLDKMFYDDFGGPAKNSQPPIPEVVCVGIVSPAEVSTVDRMPEWNTGATWSGRADYISEDAAIVATSLKQWGLNVGLVANRLGDDPSGHNVLDELMTLGITGHFELDTTLRTPYEIVFADTSGGRTFVWDRRIEVLKTLSQADISIIEGSRHVYADWYDWPHNSVALEEAQRNEIPVLINMEDRYTDSRLADDLLPYASTVQVSLPEHDDTDPELVATHMLRKGVSSVLITGASKGSKYISGSESFSVKAPSVNLVDANGAGAVFSAGYLYGVTKGWDSKESVRFGVAAASIQCEVVGPTAADLEIVMETASCLITRDRFGWT